LVYLTYFHYCEVNCLGFRGRCQWGRTPKPVRAEGGNRRSDKKVRL